MDSQSINQLKLCIHVTPDTNNPLHYYSDDAVQTKPTSCGKGVLDITTVLSPHNFTNVMAHQNETKEVKTGMITSWNKVCFVGGIVEFSVKLPGKPRVAGLWPAVWMMGNLARATYLNSTEGQWPFSSNVCTDGTRHSQCLNRCNATTTPKLRSFFRQHQQPGTRAGRGAPEIDLLEVMWMDKWKTDTYDPPPVLSASLQVAPGKEGDRPQTGSIPPPNITWYEPELGPATVLNQYFYGVNTQHSDPTLNYQTDAVSFNYLLNDSFYERQHTYRLEWEPPQEDSTGGYVRWYIDDVFVAGVTGEDLQRVSATEIPSEPMYLIANVAVSKGMVSLLLLFVGPFTTAALRLNA